MNVCSLPMRNWNTETFNSCPSKASCMQSTYEELKQSYSFAISLIPSQYAVLPMRNWNIDLFKNIIQAVLVCSLPIRNWNTTSFLIWRPPHDSMQFTYKELKLSSYVNVFLLILVCGLPIRNWNYSTMFFMIFGCLRI